VERKPPTLTKNFNSGAAYLRCLTGNRLATVLVREVYIAQ